MDRETLQREITRLMMSVEGHDPARLDDFRGYAAEVEAVLATGEVTADERDDWQLLLEMLGEHCVMLETEPELARVMGEALSESLAQGVEPRPNLIDAIEDGDLDRVRAALEGSDVNTPHGEFAVTPLYVAMSCMDDNALEIMNLLLDAGADPKIGIGSVGALHGLAFGHIPVAPEALAEVISRCVSLGADLEERTEGLGWTPLIAAASEWQPVAVEALLLAGADVRARAGERAGVCFSGASVLAFAEGHPATEAVVRRYLRSN
jgi:hypothetical protein